MSTDEQTPTSATSSSSSESAAAPATDVLVDQDRSAKILQAKELYSQGSRNYLMKSYAEAADELSRVCELYGELYGELSDEVAMPYLLYAKSLIALNEFKIIDVPDEANDDDDDEDDDEAGEESDTEGAANGEAKGKSNGEAAASSTAKGAGKLDTIAENAGEKKATVADVEAEAEADSTASDNAEKAVKKPAIIVEKASEEAEVSSTDETQADGVAPPKATEGAAENGEAVAIVPVDDGEKPSTSNGSAKMVVDEPPADEEEEGASGLQLAWEILELAARIFSRQGHSGLPNLAEVQTELGNIEFENGLLEAARDDFEKALRIYQELQLTSNYRRAMAEMQYKMGLTFLMEQQNKEGAAALKEACALLEDEITVIKAKPDLTEKDNNNVQDMEETMQEIQLKIAEIEDMGAQIAAEVRAALDDYKNPNSSTNGNGAGPSAASAVSSGGAGSSSSSAAAAAAASSSASAPSSSSSAIISSSKPTDITHLIKRKKPEEPTSEAEAAASPAKRPAL